MNRLLTGILAGVLLTAGCDGPSFSDAGTLDGALDAGTDGAGTLCAADNHCDDGLWCNGVERCVPGDPAAGADGCVNGAEQCTEMACNEDSDSCDCGAASDMDMDGHDSVACGGDDCEDGDPDRYPGNPEVCDPEAHDEDCDMSTVGSLDDDSDGAFSFTCCNGDTCGTDCDDADVNVNPSATEECDGIDNDCDGETDSGGVTALCPGGMCFAGRCNFTGWDRVFGGPGEDRIAGVAIDAAGNVYVAGWFSDTARFGTTDVTSVGHTDIFVMSYLPTGEYRWHVTYGSSSFDQATGIATSPDGTVYVVGSGFHPMFGGSGVGSDEGYGFIVALDQSGAYLRHRFIPKRVYHVAMAGTDVVVSSTYGSGDDLGCGVVPDGPDATNGIVAAYDASLGCQWHHPTTTRFHRAFAATSGAVLFAGLFTDELTLYGTAYPNEGANDFYVVSLDAATGTETWHQVYGAPGDVSVWDVAIDGLGQSYVVGRFEGEFNLGAAHQIDSGDDREGFLLALSDAGVHAWHHFLDARGFDGSGDPDSGYSQLWDVAVLPGGSVSVVGQWGTLNAESNVLDLGGGDRTTTTGRQQFVAEYSQDGAFQRDFVVAISDAPTDVALGPGGMMVWAGFFAIDIELGSGTRTSRGEFDAWLARIGS